MFKFMCLVLFALQCDFTAACDGFKLRFKSVENCGGDNQIVTLDKNFTAILTPDCQVTSVGCITSKGFTKATARYSIVKNGMPIISGNPDLCAALDKKGEEAKAKLEMFGFPTECPFPEGRKCMDGQKKLSIAKFKKFLSMAAGKMEIEADILHDTGKSCIKIKFTLDK